MGSRGSSNRFLLPFIVALSLIGVIGLVSTLVRGPKTAQQAGSTTQTTEESPAPKAGLSVSPTAQTPSSQLALDAKSAQQLRVLNEILVTRNDNDPRLDRELKGFSPEGKAALRARYAELPPEDLNGRGTIVYLLGREAATARDMEFFQQVLAEPPCLSLASCSKEPPASASTDLHHEATNEITLAYPQLVALKSLEASLSGEGRLDEPAREAARKAIEAGKASGNPVVAAKAAQLEKRLQQ
ncbi:MAG: hypothetical protein NDJ90_05255 [Oligoflexia bacterium]|nr:hypothetical protein [Oligoflexia bacterium]